MKRIAIILAALLLASLAAAPAADPERPQKSTETRAEFFTTDKVVRLDIEVDAAGMEVFRKTPHPWLDRKIGEDIPHDLTPQSCFGYACN